MAQRRGVAHDFWLLIERARVERGLTKLELSEAAGIPRPTIDNLRTSTRPPQPRIVHALADAVDVDRTEAAQLAGLLPRTSTDGISVRDAILASPSYTAAQKDALLAMVDVLDEANQGLDRGDRSDEAV